MCIGRIYHLTFANLTIISRFNKKRVLPFVPAHISRSNAFSTDTSWEEAGDEESWNW